MTPFQNLNLDRSLKTLISDFFWSLSTSRLGEQKIFVFVVDSDNEQMENIKQLFSFVCTLYNCTTLSVHKRYVQYSTYQLPPLKHHSIYYQQRLWDWIRSVCGFLIRFKFSQFFNHPFNRWSFFVRLFEVSIELIIIILPLHCEHENQVFFKLSASVDDCTL